MVNSSPKLRIVIADDEPDVREFLSRACQLCGFEVVGVAENGVQLTRCCADCSPDLILTDVMMPKVDGLTALGEIREQVAIPSIVITAHDRPELRLQAAEFGAVAYLIKPVSLASLRDILKIAEQRVAESRRA